jgi:hypothetical protein
MAAPPGETPVRALDRNALIAAQIAVPAALDALEAEQRAG